MDTTEQATTPAADAAPSSAVQSQEVADAAPAHGEDDFDTSEEDYMPDPDAVADEQDDAGLSDEERAERAAAGDGKGTPASGDQDEMVEVEYAEGKKASIPKELQRGFLRHDDYTRKTQQVSAAAKEVAAKAEALTAAEEVGKSLVAEHAKVHTLEDRVQQYAKMSNQDWTDLRAEDPEAYDNHWRSYQVTKEQLAAAKNDLDTKTKDRLDSHRKESETARDTARKETGQALVQEIPGWNGTVAREVIQHGMEKFGIDADEFVDMTDVRPWKVLHANLQHEKTIATQAKEITALKATLAKQRTADQHETAAKPRPAARTGGSTPASGPSDTQKTASWMAKRDRQVAERQKR